MRNASIEPAGLIVHRNRGVRTAVLILTLVVFATGVFALLSAAMDRGVSAPQSEVATDLPAAGADSPGLISLSEPLRRNVAETARWEARAEYYRQDRARQAETDRLTGLAEHLATNGLSRSQQAEADRLTGLAEYLGIDSP